MKDINPENTYFSYIRVSTRKQAGMNPKDAEAELQGSLAEQRRQNEYYAQGKGLVIYDEVIEVESASEINRPKFKKMLDDLEFLHMKGIVFNKVDRSARNPLDQARLFTMFRSGYEFHFASENTSTLTHLGIGQVYMFWGMANVYSENLKFEVNKGINAAHHEGRSTLPCPVGYLDMGRHTYKEPDPVKAFLVKQAFELYAGGYYALTELTKKMNALGLTTKSGRPFGKNAISKMLRNPFYYGDFIFRKQIHQGKHKPIISKQLYDKVQQVMSGTGYKKIQSFAYIFQNLLYCHMCNKKLACMAAKKGRYRYYHCKNRECSKPSFNETEIEAKFLIKLKAIQFTEEEGEKFIEGIKQFRSDMTFSREEELKIVTMEETRIKGQREALVLRYVEGKIEDDVYETLKTNYINELATLRDRRNALDKVDGQVLDQMVKLKELLRFPNIAYKKASPETRRRLVRSMLVKLVYDGEKLTPHWQNEFQLVAEAKNVQMVG